MAHWIEANTCSNCGEAEHEYFCPKPDHITKEQWQKMTEEEKYMVEMKEIKQ